MPGRDPSAPADTRDIAIVHDALRRDLARARATIGGSRVVPDSRRQALADHLRWMMDFLRHHHGGEDHGLWPRVRAKNAGASELIDAMEAAHRSVDPRVTQLDEVAAPYGDGGSASEAIAAIDSLESALLPHLREEEDETMPLVSGSLTQADWDAYNAEENIGTRSPFQLGATALDDGRAHSGACGARHRPCSPGSALRSRARHRAGVPTPREGPVGRPSG
jgi:hemerythrin-like domain-containing protein